MKKALFVTGVNKENGGHASARNTGIDVACKSQSKWITFIDVDDWIDKYYLEYLLKSSTNHNLCPFSGI